MESGRRPRARVITFVRLTPVVLATLVALIAVAALQHRPADADPSRYYDCGEVRRTGTSSPG